MRAAVIHGPDDLRIEERGLPDLGPEDVLIEVDRCGICGTDLHLVLEGWARPGTIPGHEYAGRLAALGTDIDDLAVGEAVVAEPSRTCGTCAGCRAGRPSLCVDQEREGGWDGAFAEYVRVHRQQIHRVPEGLPMETAALTEPLAVALHALTRGGAAPGQRVLVTGAGPLGLLAVAALNALHGVEAVVSEPSPSRRARAAAVGACATLDPGKLTGPVLPTELVAEPFDLVLECSGAAPATTGALGQLAAGGTLVVVGSGLEPPVLDSNRVLLHELTVTGSFNYDAGGFDAALALLASGQLPIDELREPDPVALDGVLDALRGLAAGDITRKLLVAP